MNTLSIAVVGGDLRMLRLAEKLSKKHKVYIYAIEGEDISKEIVSCKTLQEIKNCDYMIGPIPLSKDQQYVHTPLSQEKVLIETLFQNISPKKFIAGAIKQEIRELLDHNKISYMDLMQIEEMAIANAIPTKVRT